MVTNGLGVQWNPQRMPLSAGRIMLIRLSYNKQSDTYLYILLPILCVCVWAVVWVLLILPLLKKNLFFPNMQCTRTRALSFSHCSAKRNSKDKRKNVNCTPSYWEIESVWYVNTQRYLNRDILNSKTIDKLQKQALPLTVSRQIFERNFSNLVYPIA